jgi:hypothetical protein
MSCIIVLELGEDKQASVRWLFGGRPQWWGCPCGLNRSECHTGGCLVGLKGSVPYPVHEIAHVYPLRITHCSGGYISIVVHQLNLILSTRNIKRKGTVVKVYFQEISIRSRFASVRNSMPFLRTTTSSSILTPPKPRI